MTYQEKVNYLKSYKQLSDRLEYINNRIMGIKAITYDNNHNSEPKQLNDYLDEKDEILENMSNIRDLIRKIKDYKQRLVLKYVFLEFNSLKQTAYHANYSYAQIKRYYKSAIENIEL